MKDLAECFDKKRVTQVWREIVKNQLRKMDILDLHDYYDFNVSIEVQASQISDEILAGQYASSKPLIYKVEKKLGICRHLMIPTPSDALVFQVIVESISKELHKKAPSKKAYYSRESSRPKLPHESGDDSYPWFIQWKKFQKDIYQFSKEYDYLVVTDISNFFDSVGLRELRHVIASGTKIPEVILDLIFMVIENLSWNPDYLPTSPRGLPTINIEAMRLLAHCFLFEVDEVLLDCTSGDFVRWMDDINFGVNSVSEGSKILGQLNDVLKSRGLALNLAKTKIYSSKEVQRHFLVRENRFLDSFSKKTRKSTIDILKLRSEFRKHLSENGSFQNYDKVTKRYFSAFSEIRSDYLCSYVRKIFVTKPSLRQKIGRYLTSLGPKKKVKSIVIDLLRDISPYDDVTVFELIKVATELKISLRGTDRVFVNDLLRITKTYEEGFLLYCRFWIVAKYGTPNLVLKTIESTRHQWSKDSFLKRQMISILPRIAHAYPDQYRDHINECIVNGPRDCASVAANLLSLTTDGKVLSRVRPYLFPINNSRSYPLSKFLIGLAVLDQVSDKENFKVDLMIQANDPFYNFWIESVVSKKRKKTRID